MRILNRRNGCALAPSNVSLAGLAGVPGQSWMMLLQHQPAPIDQWGRRLRCLFLDCFMMSGRYLLRSLTEAATTRAKRKIGTATKAPAATACIGFCTPRSFSASAQPSV